MSEHASQHDGHDRPASVPPSRVRRGRHDHLLRSLFELSRDLTVALDLFDTTDLLLFNLMGQVGTARSCLWLTSARDAVLAIVRCHGFNRSLVNGAMVASLKPMLVQLGEDAVRPRAWLEASELADNDFKLIHQADIALMAPLRARGELIGWIALGERVDGRPYGPDELEVLETALGMVTMALENTRLFNREREANRSLMTANEHLKEMDRLKSEFLGNVNHELRTPLAVVNGAIELALEGAPLPPTTRRLLESAHEASRNLSAIIENLLLWSECAQDRVVITLEDSDVGAVIDSVCRVRLPGITEDLRELIFERPEALPLACFDPDRLTQVLDELLDNAVKFTPRGTLLKVRVVAESDGAATRIRIDVEDNGPGIPADRLETLFKSFEQVDGSMTRRVGGLGLGLAFAKVLVERMGGSLQVSSRVGVGTTFTVRIPAATPDANSRRAA